MGLQRVARVAVPLLGISLLTGGCSGAAKRFGFPDVASEQGEQSLHLWQGAWIAALGTGIVVWGLIFYTVFKFRRRSDDEIPIQTRYNLPLEIFYTVAPVVMVVVFFAHTVKTQDKMLEDNGHPDNIIEVTGQQWSWTFNYGIGKADPSADDDRFDQTYPYSSYVHDGGTGSYIPTLYLPVGETTRFNLHSPDVIHDFGVPKFGMRMDVIPGRVNHYVITPTRTGTFKGKCYELCGIYHSRMLFVVKVVSPEDYAQHVKDLQSDGDVTDKPLLGGADAYSQAGLASPEDSPEGDSQQ